jgi:hypothetical protein
MCVVSMVIDHYREKWEPLIPAWLQPPPAPNFTPTSPLPQPVAPVVPPAEPRITDEEIREFRRLLERAREYDRKNNEPDCELAEKKAALQKIAEQLGVKISFD